MHAIGHVAANVSFILGQGTPLPVVLSLVPIMVSGMAGGARAEGAVLALLALQSSCASGCFVAACVAVVDLLRGSSGASADMSGGQLRGYHLLLMTSWVAAEVLLP
jgi:hypothetical protein